MNAALGITVTLSVLISFQSLSLFGPETKPATGNDDRSSEKEMKKLQEGLWGGPHIIMKVTANGAAITYDCAAGTIDEPIKIDDQGRFQVEGTYTPQRGGPVRSDETQDRNPALYEGHLDGKSLRLIVTLPNKKERAGTFQLKYGEVPELTRCM